MHFTFFDAVFSIIILFIAIAACTHGFIAELFGKIAVVASVFVAVYFCGMLGAAMQKFITNHTLCVILAFILLFIATFLLVKIVQTIIKSIFSGEILKSLDRVLGFVLGAFEGLCIVAAIFIILKAQPWFDLNGPLDSSFYWKMLSKFLSKPIDVVGGLFA